MKPHVQQAFTPASWHSLVNPDTSTSASFYYAVKTTGIYCRPSCKSRPPRPENVRIFATCAEARQAGYRACKRCHPDGL